MRCRCDELREDMFELHLSKNMGIEEMMTLVSHFQTPEEIFPFASALKEQGNILVKIGKIEEAASVYKKAASFLVLGMPCCVQDHHPFRDLIMPITLNLALCALNLSKFKWAKRLCGCVLKFDPSNVKALFRRGSAAISLGQLHEAETDLLAARKIVPSNSDVIKEWNKLNRLLGEFSGKPSESSTGGFDMECNVGSKVEDVCTPLSMGFNPLNLPPSSKPTRSESVGSNMNDELDNSNLIGSNANFQECKTDSPMLDCVMEDSKSGLHQNPFNPYLAEPKRFSNQVRPGSFLKIPQSDYKKLANGRTLNYSHPRLVGFISIKVISNNRAPNPPSNPTPESPKCPTASSTCSDMQDIQVLSHHTSQPTTDSGSCIVESSWPASASSGVRAPSVVSNIEKVARKSYSPNLHGNQKRRAVKSRTRYFKSKASCSPGGKRKSSSNTFITSYPLWKKRKGSEWFDKLQHGANYDWDSFSSSGTKRIHWTTNNPDGFCKLVGTEEGKHRSSS